MRTVNVNMRSPNPPRRRSGRSSRHGAEGLSAHRGTRRAVYGQTSDDRGARPIGWELEGVPSALASKARLRWRPRVSEDQTPLSDCWLAPGSRGLRSDPPGVAAHSRLVWLR